MGDIAHLPASYVSTNTLSLTYGLRGWGKVTFLLLAATSMTFFCRRASRRSRKEGSPLKKGSEEEGEVGGSVRWKFRLNLSR